MRSRKSHIFDREGNDWYVDPPWCSQRLIEEEHFAGNIYDPCCGWGATPAACISKGIPWVASDIVDRGFYGTIVMDFLNDHPLQGVDNIVCNPPFALSEQFARRALAVAKQKVALLLPVARAPAAHWMEELPLSCMWLLTPRPSMPPGSKLLNGKAKAENGRVDYAFFVFTNGYLEKPVIRWLKRGEKNADAGHNKNRRRADRNQHGQYMRGV